MGYRIKETNSGLVVRSFGWFTPTLVAFFFLSAGGALLWWTSFDFASIEDPLSWDFFAYVAFALALVGLLIIPVWSCSTTYTIFDEKRATIRLAKCRCCCLFSCGSNVAPLQDVEADVKGVADIYDAGKIVLETSTGVFDLPYTSMWVCPGPFAGGMSSDRALETIREWLDRKGYRRAVVELQGPFYDANGNGPFYLEEANALVLDLESGLIRDIDQLDKTRRLLSESDSRSNSVLGSSLSKTGKKAKKRASRRKTAHKTTGNVTSEDDFTSMIPASASSSASYSYSSTRSFGESALVTSDRGTDRNDFDAVESDSGSSYSPRLWHSVSRSSQSSSDHPETVTRLFDSASEESNSQEYRPSPLRTYSAGRGVLKPQSAPNAAKKYGSKRIVKFDEASLRRSLRARRRSVNLSTSSARYIGHDSGKQ